MIFRDTSTISSILPLIKTNKNENTERNERNKYSLMEQHTQNNINNNNNKYNFSLDLNYAINNRYNNQKTNNSNENKNDNYMKQETDINKKHESQIFNKRDMILRSRNILNDFIPFTTRSRNPFNAKVILENIESKKDCVYLLNQYLQNHNIQCQYEISTEKDKIIFSFDDEKTAFDFTKIIYNEKIRNPSFKYVVVHMKLLPNKYFLKMKKLERYKKGLSNERLKELVSGTNTKREKRIKKVNLKGVIDFGLKSPFPKAYDIHRKFNSVKTIKNKNKISRNDNNKQIYEYIGYDGLPLKSYDKSRISVLDTHYNPVSASSILSREDNKKKWISPSNFNY